MAYSELVKSFERIRSYMREFYVYGFKSREEYSIKSARSYDNERRRIESWIGDFMSFHQDTSGSFPTRRSSDLARMYSSRLTADGSHTTRSTRLLKPKALPIRTSPSTSM